MHATNQDLSVNASRLSRITLTSSLWSLVSIGASGQAVGAALLVIGVVLGATLVLGTQDLTGSLQAKTATEMVTKVSTMTVTTTTVYTVTVANTSGTVVKTAAVSATAVACEQGTGGTTSDIICSVSVVNVGNAGTKIEGSATLSYSDSTLGAETVSGTVTGAPIAVPADGNADLTVTFAMPTGYGGPVRGSVFSGSLSTSNGGSPLFSGSF